MQDIVSELMIEFAVRVASWKNNVLRIVSRLHRLSPRRRSYAFSQDLERTPVAKLLVIKCMCIRSVIFSFPLILLAFAEAIFLCKNGQRRQEQRGCSVLLLRARHLRITRLSRRRDAANKIVCELRMEETSDESTTFTRQVNILSGWWLYAITAVLS